VAALGAPTGRPVLGRGLLAAHLSDQPLSAADYGRIELLCTLLSLNAAYNQQHELRPRTTAQALAVLATLQADGFGATSPHAAQLQTMVVELGLRVGSPGAAALRSRLPAQTREQLEARDYFRQTTWAKIEGDLNDRLADLSRAVGISLGAIFDPLIVRFPDGSRPWVRTVQDPALTRIADLRLTEGNRHELHVRAPATGESFHAPAQTDVLLAVVGALAELFAVHQGAPTAQTPA
jgi:hypothetical protein